MPFKRKSISIHWELMFTRSMYETDDIEKQGELLQQVAQLVDQQKIRSTLNQNLGKIGQPVAIAHLAFQYHRFHTLNG